MIRLFYPPGLLADGRRLSVGTCRRPWLVHNSDDDDDDNNDNKNNNSHKNNNNKNNNNL